MVSAKQYLSMNLLYFVTTAPGPPSNLRVVGGNTTHIMLDWDPSPPGPGLVRGYSVNYTDSGYNDFFEMRTASNETMAEIPNLYPGRLYYFRVYPRTGRRYGYPSAVVGQQTDQDCKCDNLNEAKQ